MVSSIGISAAYVPWWISVCAPTQQSGPKSKPKSRTRPSSKWPRRWSTSICFHNTSTGQGQSYQQGRRYNHRDHHQWEPGLKGLHIVWHAPSSAYEFQPCRTPSQLIVLSIQLKSVSLHHCNRWSDYCTPILCVEVTILRGWDKWNCILSWIRDVIFLLFYNMLYTIWPAERRSIVSNYFFYLINIMGRHTHLPQLNCMF